MKSQPFIYFTLSLACGICMAKFIPVTWLYVLMSLFLLLAFSIILKNKHSLVSVLIGLIFIGIGLIRYQTKTEYTHLETRENKTFYLVKIIGSLKPSEKYNKYFGEIKNTQILMYVKDKKNVYLPDDEVWIYGNLTTIPSPKNPHQFNYKNYLLNHNIHYQVFTDSVSKVKSVGRSWKNSTEKAKIQIKNNLRKQGYSKGTIAMLSAMLLGDKSELDDDLYNNFRRVGVVHLLAISGLHVAMIFGIFYALFGVFSGRYGKKLRIILSLFFIWCFAFFVNFSPSVSRACLMLTLYFLAQLLNRPSNALHTLALSAFILLLINPLFLFDVGFQLSYCAVFFIGWFFPFFKQHLPSRFRIIQYFRDILGSSIAAQLGTAPLVIYYFNTFSWLFLLGNLVLIPLTFVVLALGILVILLAYFDLKLILLVDFYNGFITLIQSYINYLSGWDNWVETNIHLSTVGLLVFLLGLFLLGEFLRKFNPTLALLCLSLVLIFEAERLYDFYKKSNEKEIIIFHQYKNSVIGLRNGNLLDVFIRDTLQQQSINRYIIEPYMIHERIDSVNFYALHERVQKYYSKTEDVIWWGNQKILLNSTNSLTTDFDLILVNPSQKIDWNLIQKKPPTTLWLADGFYYSYYIDKLDSLSNVYHFNFYATQKSGAFMLKNESF